MTSAPYYQDEHVTLYHGDCLTITDWLAADVLVTDPPYGVRWERRFGDATLGTVGRSRQRNIVHGDADTTARDDVLTVWGERPAMVFGSWRVSRPSGLHALLIWHKEGSYSGPSGTPFFTNHEEVYVIGTGWVTSGKPLRSVITTTETRHHEPARNGHPTSKPTHLMESLIRRCPLGVVADPFAGSGSTLIAAKQLGRHAIGVEIEERYCEIAAKRLSQDVLDFGGAA